MMTSRSLAFTTLGAKEQRAKASEASKDAIGMMGIRIHEVMSAIEDKGLQNDNELQLNLREIQRVLDRVSPVLQKVSKKVGTPTDFEGVAIKDGSFRLPSDAPSTSPTSTAMGPPAHLDNHNPKRQLGLDHRKAVVTEIQKEGGIHETVEHDDSNGIIEAGEVQPTGGIRLQGAVIHVEGAVSMQWDSGPPHGVGRYEGFVEGGQPNGRGVMNWPSGKTFRGFWKHGKRHGQGWQRWTDGRTFEGDWQDGKPHGVGTWTSPRGESYEGGLVRGKKSGKGTFTYADGWIYTGEWLDGKRQGQGTRFYPDGSVYIGLWRNDSRNGQGVYKWKDGREWSGDWSDGNPIKKGSRDQTELDIARTGSENHSSSDLVQVGNLERQKTSVSTETFLSQASAAAGTESLAAEKGFRAVVTRAASAAAAGERLKNASALKTDSAAVGISNSNDWIERQGTASTLAGTMTDSEWTALLEDPKAGCHGHNINRASSSKINKNNANNNDSNGIDEVNGGQRDNCTSFASPPARAGVSSDTRRNAATISGGKSKGLFGGAAELIGQWGTVRMLGSVGRRRGDRSASRERGRRPGTATPEKPWGYKHSDGGSSSRSRRSKSKDRSGAESACDSPSSPNRTTRPRSRDWGNLGRSRRGKSKDRLGADGECISPPSSRSTRSRASDGESARQSPAGKIPRRDPSRPGTVEGADVSPLTPVRSLCVTHNDADKLPQVSSVFDFSPSRPVSPSAGPVAYSRLRSRVGLRGAVEPLLLPRCAAGKALLDSAPDLDRGETLQRRYKKEYRHDVAAPASTKEGSDESLAQFLPSWDEVEAHTDARCGASRKTSNSQSSGQAGVHRAYRRKRSSGTVVEPRLPQQSSTGGTPGTVNGRSPSTKELRRSSRDLNGSSRDVERSAIEEDCSAREYRRSGRSMRSCRREGSSENNERVIETEEGDGSRKLRESERSRSSRSGGSRKANPVDTRTGGTDGSSLPIGHSLKDSSSRSLATGSENRHRSFRQLGPEKESASRRSTSYRVPKSQWPKERRGEDGIKHDAAAADVVRDGRSHTRQQSQQELEIPLRARSVSRNRSADRSLRSRSVEGSRRSERRRREEHVNEKEGNKSNARNGVSEGGRSHCEDKLEVFVRSASSCRSGEHDKDSTRTKRNATSKDKGMVNSVAVDGRKSIRIDSQRLGDSTRGRGRESRGSREKRRDHPSGSFQGSMNDGDYSWTANGRVSGGYDASASDRHITDGGDVISQEKNKDGGERWSSGSGNVQASKIESFTFDMGKPHGGGNYVGKVKDNIPHGEGRIDWPSGRTFTGTWKRGKWTGYGVFLWPDGRRQEGQWLNNSAEGLGKMVYLDESTYVGHFSNGLKHGNGVRRYTCGEIYDGEWRYGLRNGKGTWIAEDGDRYEGEYVDDKKSGQGTYTWADGSKHVGFWKDGVQHGQGTYTWADGSKHIGAWQGGVQHGQGIRYDSDGKIALQGKWKKGEKTLFF